MASQFFERNKRKSALAALLLLFSGRGKYVAMFLVAGVVSVPFLVSGERLAAIFSGGPFGAILRAVGVTSLMEGQGNSYSSQDMIASAALAGATAPGSKASFWDRYLRAANAPLPPAGSPSSMGMLRGGEDLAGPPVIKDQPGEKPKGPGQVKGVVNKEERSADEGPAGLDIASMLDGAGSSGYGSSMGQGLAGSAAPYLNRSMMSSSGGALDTSAEMHARVIDNMNEKVPVPNNPRTSKAKMGKLSNFAWRNLGRKNSRSAALGRGMNSKKPRYQLSETVAMTGMAFASKGAEYESTYSGATYDGTDVDANLLTAGETVVPTSPGSGFAGDLLGQAGSLMDDAMKCAQVGATYGAKISEDSKKMQETMNTLDYNDPPGCCSSRRHDWNRKIDEIVAACTDSNTQAQKMAAECPAAAYEAMNCEDYRSMRINCDNPWDCIVEIFAWIFVGAIFGAVLTVCMATGLFGDGAKNFIKGIVRWMSGYDSPSPPPEQGQTVDRTLLDP